MKSRRALAIAGLVLLMVVWGSTFVLTKEAIREIPPLALAAGRFLLATLVLLPFALARGGLRALPRPLPLSSLCWMAFTGIAVFTVGFNYALQLGSASQGALIYAFAPAAVAIAAVIALKERPSRRRTAGIVLSIAGIVVIVMAAQAAGESERPILAAAWMLAGVIAWAVYTVIAKRLALADQVVVITCVSMIGALMLVPPAVAELVMIPVSSPSLYGWLGLLYLGVVASAAAYLFYSFVLRELDASLVGAYLNLDPLIGVLTAVVFLGETLTGGQMIGGALAIAGMWLASSER